jgi:hypothetical protein
LDRQWISVEQTRKTMKTLKLRFVCGLVAVGWVLAARAAVPPAEHLLPDDTLAALVMPDCARFEAAEKDSPAALFWKDAALRPFKEKLLGKLTNEVVAPIERALGIKLADYSSLVRGQFTLAITRNGWTGAADPLPGLLLIIDSGDQKDLLAKNLADVRKKLTEGGQKLKSEKIRDVEFTTLSIDVPGLPASIGGPGSGPKAEGTPKLTLSFGQSGSLLVLGTGGKDLERLLARQAGSGTGALADQPAFATDARALFRDAHLYGWVHFAPLGEVLAKLAAAQGEKGAPAGMPAPDKIMGALGLNGLKTLAFATRQGPEGGTVDLAMGVPEEQRKGLFKMVATEAKDAGPPAFVPADALGFSRWRVDVQKLWATLEATLNDISPGMLGFLTAQIEAGLKEKDPGFDFKKNLVGNLGDDLITYQKNVPVKTFEDLANAPSLVLFGSANAEQLLQTLRGLMVLAPPPFNASDIKEREFTGRKIYSLPLPTMPGAGDAKARSLNLAASGGYLAFSTDAGMIEEYIRSGDNKPKPLSGVAGLSDAAQKVGGTGTGLFGYQNDIEEMRMLVELVRNNSNLVSAMLAESPLASAGAGIDKKVKEWLDFTLLPSFEKIAKYFGITVFGGKMTPQGYAVRFYTPNPPNFRN